MSLTVRGIAVPPLMYGTAWKEDRTEELTAQALDAGFRAIDTANQRKHYHEAGVGAALRAKGLARDQLFLQTKFTYARGQDHRLPYDPAAPVGQQVKQSIASSLEHLGVERLDSYVLHGPASGYGWTADDAAVWATMVEAREAGTTRLLGVSNVGHHHLVALEKSGAELPAFVQNRCYARMGWDREVRAFCRAHDITYQGFSLLTANPEVLRSPVVHRAAQRLSATPAQVVFAFSRQIGMLPLTGTTDRDHMREDLASVALVLTDDEVRSIETISG
jgi:diketogulonate reductase-like aldo/keto reductase